MNNVALSRLLNALSAEVNSGLRVAECVAPLKLRTPDLG
jgi:hypothetical protein